VTGGSEVNAEIRERLRRIENHALPRKLIKKKKKKKTAGGKRIHEKHARRGKRGMGIQLHQEKMKESENKEEGLGGEKNWEGKGPLYRKSIKMASRTKWKKTINSRGTFPRVVPHI